MVQTQHRLDRRSKPKDPAKEMAEIIKRVEKIALEDIRAHDRHFADYDPEIWQSWYKLETHIIDDRTTARKVGIILGLDEFERQLIDCATLLHDMGKVDPRYHFYRLRKIFSDEERSMLRQGHPLSSGEYLRNFMLFVRAQDHARLEMVLPIVEHHHNPWVIKEEQPRRLAFVVHFTDIFVSLLETRHRPGLKLPMAIVAIQELLTNIEAGVKPDYTPHVEDARECIGAILKIHEGAVEIMTDA